MYWLVFPEEEQFEKEVPALKANQIASKCSPLFSLHPVVDLDGVLHVVADYEILDFPTPPYPPWKTPSHKYSSEHVRLLHTAPTFVAASLPHHRILQERPFCRLWLHHWPVEVS